ncbi:MAG: HigA family addiction module antitoxin [Thermodesulfobacteriota bacterium]
MGVHNPPHPGEVLKGLFLEPLNLTVTDAAKALGVTRKTLSQIVNGRAGISSAMAMRLSKAFGTTPEHWLRMQNTYDLWHARNSDVSGVKVMYKGEKDPGNTVNP